LRTQELAISTGQLGLTGRAQPIFPKQLKLDAAVCKTCFLLLMELELRIMLKLLHQRMKFTHFLKIETFFFPHFLMQMLEN
jgi:hypothetical protein